jgi:hypothetical protein
MLSDDLPQVWHQDDPLVSDVFYQEGGCWRKAFNEE